jgi:hypothetical protein
MQRFRGTRKEPSEARRCDVPGISRTDRPFWIPYP